MIKSFVQKNRLLVASFTILVFLGSGAVAYATHAWGSYHWARTANPFTLKLGDNVTSAWDSYLASASSEWSSSSVLDTMIVAGSNAKPKNCRPVAGRVEVCNATYGRNGWLGIASVWASGDHITQGTVKLNDTYFNMSTYNTPAWKNLVMCQEIAHTFGLDHQDENFSNPNLGTCMDYTNNPDTNQHPNQHDYEMLETIYAHLDSVSTLGQTTANNGNGFGANFESPSEWGRALKTDEHGKPSLFEQDLGNNNKVFTFVIWAENE